MERLEAMMTMMYGEMQQQRLAAAAAREQSEAAAAPLRFATYEQEIRRLPPAEAPDPYMEYSGE